MAPARPPARPGRGNLRNKANDIELASLHGTTIEVEKAKSSREEFQQIAKIFGFINVVVGLSCVVAGAVLIPLGLVQFCIKVRDCRTSLCTSRGRTRHFEGTQTTIVECNPDTPLSDRVTLNLGEGVWCGLWILIGGAVSVLVGVKPYSSDLLAPLFHIYWIHILHRSVHTRIIPGFLRSKRSHRRFVGHKRRVVFFSVDFLHCDVSIYLLLPLIECEHHQKPVFIGFVKNTG
ncbi:uncharacterized protein LOC143451404 isoform X1 [Clavelina lepadiformis]|uniref:uncharacterized protein LOC143451404 isoform X1 n=1 Tax=Clavelina lepadiformis TaxID=159417 RepID=UPI00404217DB